MCVFTPWLNPATNRSFQAADAWEGAARAIRTAAQSAASAAWVRGKIQLLPCSNRGTVADRRSRVKARGSRFTESLRRSHKNPPPGRSVRVEAGRRRAAVAQHLG